MKRIALCARVFLAAAVIFIAALALAIALRFSGWEYCTVFALMAGSVAATVFISFRAKLATARSIIDSAVICIQPALVSGLKEEAAGETRVERELHENFGIYVSCFGILLGAKIVKFNRDGVWLKSVEIGQDFISFGYGERGEEPHSIRLLYSRPDEKELAAIVENFRKETGVVPTVCGAEQAGAKGPQPAF